MAASRSTTPTPNTNLTSSSQSTTSRTLPRAHFPSIPNLEGGDQPQPLVARTRSPHNTPPATSTDRRMARPIYGESSQTSARPVDESNLSSDSQNDTADVAMGEGQYSQGHESAGPPPKKKRTRTLTTPHQAAVLHALLAKSRFPNTTMREEVGRSIGLSARKVQIWFQNQRQKARRPRSQSDASQKRSPQFGAFQSGPESVAPGSFAVSPEQSSSSHMSPGPSISHTGNQGHSMARGYPSPEPPSEAESSQLLGPGMPGSELSPELPYRGQPPIPPRPRTAYDLSVRRDDHRHQSFRSPSPQRLYLQPPVSRPTTASRPQDRDFSRTLPPLVFHPPSRTSFSAPGPSSGLQAASSKEYTSRRSLSPANPFAHRPPELTPPNLSPPYVVQPRPQWDVPSFGFALQSSSSPWAPQGHQTPREGNTPPGPVRESTPEIEAQRTEEASRPESRPPGRYDPVRGSYIYSSPPESNR